jgi:nucleoporin GLE1
MARARLPSSPLSARNSPRGLRNEDSPSRQLQWDLERALSQVHLHEIESSRLHAYQKRQHQEDLDAREAAQARVHRLELSAAHAQHEVIRKQAEAVLQAYIKKEEEEEKERLRREEEERRRLEEEKRRIAEDEARKRAEQERRAREEHEHYESQERARKEAERKAKEQADIAAKERRDKEERQRQEEKAKAEQEAEQKKQQEAETARSAAAPQPSVPHDASGHPRSDASDIEKIHKGYLTLHKKLKKFRLEFWSATRTDSALKPHVGDMRRAMRTSVGQLTDDKAANRIAVSNTS